jgi:hypothetical protein
METTCDHICRGVPWRERRGTGTDDAVPALLDMCCGSRVAGQASVVEIGLCGSRE